MNRFKRLALAGFGSLASLSAFATGDSGSFDPSTYISEATTTVTAIATGLGALLAAVLAIYLAYVGYRKVREALNKA